MNSSTLLQILDIDIERYSRQLILSEIGAQGLKIFVLIITKGVHVTVDMASTSTGQGVPKIFC